LGFWRWGLLLDVNWILFVVLVDFVTLNVNIQWLLLISHVLDN